MRFETLSPTLNKKDADGNPLPNIVTVSNTAFHKDGTGATLEIKFPAEMLSYPQHDSLAEWIADCDGEARALEVVNEITAKYASTLAKNAIRNATTGDEASIVEAGIKIGRAFSWKLEQKLSTKTKADLFDLLMSEKDKLTPDQLVARIAELSGK